MSESDHNEQGVFMDHYRKIAEQKEVVDAAKKAYSKLRKEAKADGIKLADMDFAMKCAEIEDGSIIVHDLARRAQIAGWFNLPINTQGQLFPDDYDPEPNEDDFTDDDFAEGEPAAA